MLQYGYLSTPGRRPIRGTHTREHDEGPHETNTPTQAHARWAPTQRHTRTSTTRQDTPRKQPDRVGLAVKEVTIIPRWPTPTRARAQYTCKENPMTSTKGTTTDDHRTEPHLQQNSNKNIMIISQSHSTQNSKHRYDLHSPRGLLVVSSYC